MKRRASRVPVNTLLLVAVLAAGACASQQVSSSTSSGTTAAVPGLGPVLAVERFLQAASTNDLETMAALFGTADGPIGGRREEIELRMSAIASILEHDDYEIGTDSREPGRTHPTRRIGVTIINGERRSENVPFLVVETNDGDWLIEEIALEEITSR